MLNFPQQFLNNMQTLLKEEYPNFLQSLQMGEQKAIYINNNKISAKNFLKIANFKTEPIFYEPCGFYTENIKLGKHPLHLAGAFYVQDASAMFTANSINFKGDEIVLDMCAAPGGKTIQIANKIPNGVLVSNEINSARCKILYSNVERMGLKNVVITNESPSNLAKAYNQIFDVVLVDAPCSGEGMFRRGEEYVQEWNENLPKMCAERQINILNEADKCLKEGGTLIYSTCTYEEIENEQVVQKFLLNHNYQLITPKFEFSAGIGLKKATRLYPHKNRGEGQFVAVLVKNSAKNDEFCIKNGKNLTNFAKNSKNKEYRRINYQFKNCNLANEFLKQYTNLNIKTYQINNDVYYIKDPNLIKNNINYLSFGVKLGSVKNNIFKPDHFLFSAFGNNFKNFVNFDAKSNEIQNYLNGSPIFVEQDDCYGVVKLNNCPLGGYKISKGAFKNLYPKGLRI